jgi:hypothetical protein
MGHWWKSGTRWSHQYVVVRALLVEEHIEILLELISLGAEVWSRLCAELQPQLALRLAR